MERGEKRNWNREGRKRYAVTDRHCGRAGPPRPVFIFLWICLISFLSESLLFPISHRPAPENTALFHSFQTPSKGACKWAERWWGCPPNPGEGFPATLAHPPPLRRRKEAADHLDSWTPPDTFVEAEFWAWPPPNLKDLHFNRMHTCVSCTLHSSCQGLKQSLTCVPPVFTHCLPGPGEGDRAEIVKVKIYTSLFNAKNPSQDIPRNGYIHFQ